LKYWLLKTEPGTYSWSELARKKSDRWDGVRNHQARNNLAAMSIGDPALIYHSGDDKSVMGVARVSRAAYPEPDAEDPRWLAVDVQVVRPLERAVTLAEMKKDARLAGMALLKQSRLSVVPLTKDEYDTILRAAKR